MKNSLIALACVAVLAAVSQVAVAAPGGSGGSGGRPREAAVAAGARRRGLRPAIRWGWWRRGIWPSFGWRRVPGAAFGGWSVLRPPAGGRWWLLRTSGGRLLPSSGRWLLSPPGRVLPPLSGLWLLGWLGWLGGWGWGLGLGLGWGWGYPNSWAYPYSPTTLIVENDNTPLTFIEKEPEVVPAVQDLPPTHYWFYCTEPAGYYPYVQRCTLPWMMVLPQIPTGQPVAPRSVQ
jgi:hypothetical protein